MKNKSYKDLLKAIEEHEKWLENHKYKTESNNTNWHVIKEIIKLQEPFNLKEGDHYRVLDEAIPFMVKDFMLKKMTGT